MPQKNVRNLTKGHLRAGEWFFAPAGEQGDTVPDVDEAKIPAEVVELAKRKLIAIESKGKAAPAEKPVAKPAPAPAAPAAPVAPPADPLVVPDTDGQ
jgi:hypothetical protein